MGSQSLYKVPKLTWVLRVLLLWVLMAGASIALAVCMYTTDKLLGEVRFIAVWQMLAVLGHYLKDAWCQAVKEQESF